MASVHLDTSGFDDLLKRLEKLSGKQEAPVTEVFGEDFMKRHTPYSSLDEMLQAAGVTIDPEKEFGGLPENERWNNFVAKNTEFPTWQSMVQMASIEYFKRKLGM